VAAPQKASLFRYLKEAFLFRWNLLVFGGAAVAGVISGHPDIAIPLVAAGELTFLAGLTSLPRFQGAIDAKVRAEQRGAASGPVSDTPAATQSARDRIREVLGSLTDDRRVRFLKLRSRCVEMSRIANAVRGETSDASGASQELRQPALDRLLWVYLKLLLSDQAIGRFLQTADAATIQHTLDDLKTKIDARTKLVAEADRPNDRILRSLADSLATAQLRMENVGKSKGNAEFVSAELDRLENKIQAVTEMAVSHTDPDEMSSRIDAIAEGITQTEQTIRDLQNLTGVANDAETPSILAADVTAEHP
jgi:hypothetical protein